jgi:glucose/arabinose dehydrogenase/plastocyanin
MSGGSPENYSKKANNHDYNYDAAWRNGKRQLAFAGIMLTALLVFSTFSGVMLSSFHSNDNSAYAAGIENVISGKPVSVGAFAPSDLSATAINSGKPPSTQNFNISSGYKIEPVLWNLTFPSAVAFDDKGNMYIAEAGAGFGGAQAIPRILKIDQNGTISILTDRFLAGPITDIVYHDGKLYVSNKAKISTVDLTNGLVTDIITGLPSGDHAPDQIAFGKDGRVYVAIGSVTNSGVVGVDNYLPDLGWLASFPMTHDVPAKNTTLVGQSFETPNVLADGSKTINATKDMNSIKIVNDVNASAHFSSGMGTADVAGNVTGNVTTGAFVPFGNATHADEKIKGQIKCSACVISAKNDGSDLKVVASGMRLDIFSGLAFDKDGKLIVADSGSEERGSRPIRNDHDKIWKLDVPSNLTSQGQWYGWPDFFFSGANNTKKLQPATDPQFKSPRSAKPLQFLMQNHPTTLPDVFADPGYASKMTKAVLVNGTNFGFAGKMLLGEFGTHAPSTHDFNGTGIKQYIPGDNGTKIVGQKVVALDTKTGNMSDFMSLKKPDPAFRPVSLNFSPDGNALYVVSFGKSEHRTTLPNGAPLPIPQIWSYKDTGVIWRVTKTQGTQAAEMPPKNVYLEPGLMVSANSGPVPTSNMLDLPAGYKIQPILWNLDLPGSVAFDTQGNLYTGNVGYAYVGLVPPPEILKVDHQTGNVSVFADRGFDRPLTNVVFHDGKLYVSNGGKISTVDMEGRVQTIIAALPGIGDHYVDQIAFGKDGRMYFGVGTATNGAVIGRDNPWAKSIPTFHDVPGKNITMTGKSNYRTDNFFGVEKDGKFPDKVTTGAYVPFGTPNTPGQVIKGDIKCTGCILSANADGSDVRLVGWGLRHPYGLAFDQDGTHLIVSMNGIDERGSRNVANDGDKAYVIDITNSSSFGQFYGWPDFFGNAQPVTDPKFASKENGQPLAFIIKDHSPVVSPLKVFDVGAALTRVAFSNSSQFGFKGLALIGEFGTLAPQTHLTAVPEGSNGGPVMGEVIGQKVITMDPNTGNIGTFISLKTADSTFRPTGVAFSPDGNTLYIASVAKNEVRSTTPQGGVLPFTFGLPWAYPYSGVIWKVTHSPSNATNTAQAANQTGQASVTNATSSNATMINNKNAQTNIPTTQPPTYPFNAKVNIIQGAALARDKAFDPNPIYIKANGTVTWTNKDTVVHTVTSGDGFTDPNIGKEFDSGLLGGTFSHRFNATGTFDYFCQIHPTMVGKVVVEATKQLPGKPAGGVGGE